MYYFSIYKVGR